jgi:hypothetical protein
MFEEDKTRFVGAEEALRFYFRVRELLHSGRTSRLAAAELPADACLAAANAIDDCQCIGWCMHGLDDTALWLLTEVYRPTGFGVHRKTFSQVCRAGRLEFPERQFSVREVRMVHEHALGVVKRGLRLLGLIPIRQPQAVRERRQRVRTADKGAHLQVSQAASRG